MKRILAVLAFALLCWSGGSHAQDVSSGITAGEVSAHVDFLASDLLEGRDSGHRGGRLAALYVATQFELCGLAPLLDDWQMEFEIKGAAGAGRVFLSYGGELELDRQNVSIRPFSACGSITGTAELADGNPSGHVVISAEQGGDEADHVFARDLAGQGALAVIFVSDQKCFNTPRSRDYRRRGGGRAKRGQGGGMLVTAENGAKTRSLPLLTIPVIRVTCLLGVDLVETAEKGARISLDVERDGRNRSANVIGLIEGSDPAFRSEYVVAGAHYDHVGMDDLGNIWNGADDNASGVAAILELADALVSLETPPRRSIILAAWGAEERGLYGSEAFARNRPVPLDRIVAYVNLDMISRNDPEFVDVMHSSDDLYEASRTAGRAHGLEVNEISATYLSASDARAFASRKVPCVFLFTGLHGDYHAPSDDPDTIDADKAARVTRTALDLLLGVANANDRPTFTEKRSKQRRSKRGR